MEKAQGRKGIAKKQAATGNKEKLPSVRVYDTTGRFLCTAKRFDAAHPLAARLGSAKDLEEVRHLQNKQKSLAKSTIKAARELLSSQRDALPWAEIIEAAPRLPEQLERAEVVLPAGAQLQIPEGAYKPVNEPSTVRPEIAPVENSSRPRRKDRIEKLYSIYGSTETKQDDLKVLATMAGKQISTAELPESIKKATRILTDCGLVLISVSLKYRRSQREKPGRDTV